MNIAKFLEETKVLENKLRQKTDDESGRLGFPALAKQLKDAGKIDEQIVADLKKLWELRNQVYSSSTPDDNIADEAQTLLDSLISNPKLQ
ncbi:MAG: hypothetical protein QME57_04240 [Patescibacteria group bacterium]|nr:hypothetical protein [Patescibacteria group bacterium]